VGFKSKVKGEVKELFYFDVLGLKCLFCLYFRCFWAYYSELTANILKKSCLKFVWE